MPYSPSHRPCCTAQCPAAECAPWSSSEYLSESEDHDHCQNTCQWVKTMIIVRIPIIESEDHDHCQNTCQRVKTMITVRIPVRDYCHNISHIEWRLWSLSEYLSENDNRDHCQNTFQSEDHDHCQNTFQSEDHDHCQNTFQSEDHDHCQNTCQRVKTIITVRIPVRQWRPWSLSEYLSQSKDESHHTHNFSFTTLSPRTA